jgi:diguanylate cyclase (GGDEF)-like protein
METNNTLSDKVRTGVRRTEHRPGGRRGAGMIADNAPLSSMSHPSPLKLVLVTIVSIFIAESVVMTLLSFLPPISNKLETLLDSSLLIALVLLPIYFFFMKPMKSSLAERKVLEDKLRSLSLTDELTGLYNRRGLFAYGEHEVKIAKRDGEELCVLYADMDNFKKINDELGHKEGDKALVNISSILKTSFRESDIIARLGGDEFVIIPVGTEMENVDLMTERLERRIEEHNNTVPDAYKLSLSIGTACSDSVIVCSIDDLLAIADRLMYEHKISKNCYHK